MVHSLPEACKTNLFRWLSLAVDELNKDPAGIVHCWKETELLRAWEGPVQAETAGMDIGQEDSLPQVVRLLPAPTDLEEDLTTVVGCRGLTLLMRKTLFRKYVLNIKSETLPSRKSSGRCLLAVTGMAADAATCTRRRPLDTCGLPPWPQAGAFGRASRRGCVG